jgi:glutamine kinase
MKKKRYKRVAYSFVIADLLHYGHLKILKTAKNHSDYHICGLISDESCHLWQGVNICNFEERKAVLMSLDCVDEIMLQDSMDPAENLKKIKKRYTNSELIVVHGDDWKTMPAREYIETIGGKIIQPEYYSKLSRNSIISKFKDELPQQSLQHEYYTHHFRIGNIHQFNKQEVSPLVSTKANTLKNFKQILKLSKIEELFICTVKDYGEYPDQIVDLIRKQFNSHNLIIRSSSLNEDMHNFSNAGSFTSILNVSSGNVAEIHKSITTVIAEFKKRGSLNYTDQVLVQRQTPDIKKSGVVFTRNIGTNAPYYVVNYDDETGKTDTVTGGEIAKSILLLRDITIAKCPKEWRSLILSVREIESHLTGMILDIEFGEKTDGSIVIFQIRPLAANILKNEDDEKFIENLNDQIESFKFESEISRGKTEFLSDMAFWNPSEIIGDNPHPLDYSLYREIITKKAWNDGIADLGYTRVNEELMTKYGNKPYIYLWYSFLSLVPAEIKSSIKHKLIDVYSKKLKADLTAHDKIEFEIVLSCYDFMTEEKLCELKEVGFLQKETDHIRDELLNLTHRIIGEYPEVLKKGRQELARLEKNRAKLTSLAMKTKSPIVATTCFLELVKAISKYGTPQFAGIARQAFIANALLQSMVKKKHLDYEEAQGLLTSISTVATSFDRDLNRFICNGELTEKDFKKKYGHLRPGTYDITASRYDKMDFHKDTDQYHGELSIDKLGEKSYKNLNLKGFKKAILNSPLRSSGSGNIIRFIKSTIKEREKFKFEFTRTLSDALEILAKVGEQFEISKDDMAFLDIETIEFYKFMKNENELKRRWKQWISVNKTNYYNNHKLSLPPVITNIDSFKIIRSEISRPNFNTKEKVKGRVVNLSLKKDAKVNGKIVLIEKADPGYDWIFTKQIKGLITKYGGAASHMGIRCAEFNIPAAIGCGEQIYNNVLSWEKIIMDCKNKKIIPAINGLGQ